MLVSGKHEVVLKACGWTAAVLLALFAIQVGTDLAGSEVTAVFEDYLYNGLLLTGAAFCTWRAVAVEEERLAWALMGAGIAIWTAGDILWTVMWAQDPNAPYPSVSDGFWLAWYPASFAVLFLLVRARIASFRASLWFDGTIGALCVMALALRPVARLVCSSHERYDGSGYPDGLAAEVVEAFVRALGRDRAEAA